MWKRAVSSLFGNKVVRNEETGAEPAAPAAGASASSTPLVYEQFAKEFRQLSQQDNFDGFRVEVGKAVTPLLQVSHSLFLGTTLAEGGYMYSFGPIFQSKDQRTVFVGKVGLDGMVNGRFIKKLMGESAEFIISGNSSLTDPQRNMCQVSLDYTGSSWTASMKVARQMAWILNGALSQKVTSNLHVGGEIFHVDSNGGGVVGQLGFRYANDKNVVTGTLQRGPDFSSPQRQQDIHKAQVQYVRKVTDRLSLGSELEYSVPDQKSAMRFGYEYTFRNARIQGLVDTAGRISCMAQDAQGLGVSGTIDYVRSDYKFGFLMHIYPAPEEGAQK
eukprot:GEMP01035618.1.p1 GENE.GEMP01035618.1~~GEMP01035618.1.p1  ORF type:complete len:357 (+),score=60.48 GEMP01035618.1:82-1071(+)